MTRSVYFYILSITLLITGCLASSPESPKTNLPTLEGIWKIQMSHSGGIMGLSRSIEVSSDGKYTVTDERTSKTVTGELTVNKLSKLIDQVSSSEYIPAGRPDGMGCADCFIYDLLIQANGDEINIQLNDINLPNSGLESLVAYLQGLIETALN